MTIKWPLHLKIGLIHCNTKFGNQLFFLLIRSCLQRSPFSVEITDYLVVGILSDFNAQIQESGRKERATYIYQKEFLQAIMISLKKPGKIFS